MIQTGQPGSAFGGGVTIGNVVTPFISEKHTEANTIVKAYGGDINRTFLGLLKIWNQWHLQSTPILNATELSNQVIRTNGFGAELDYLVPYKLPPIRVRANIVDATVEKIGEGQTKFPLVLSDQMSPGDVLMLRSKRNGVQVRIDDKDDIERFSEGDGFVHQAYVMGDSVEDYIPREFLTPGTAVWKSDNPGGERSVHGTSISKSRNGIQQQSWKVANAERRIIHTVTSWGDMMGYNIESKKDSGVFDKLFDYPNMSAEQQKAITNYYNVDPKSDPKDPKPLRGTRTWVPSVIELMFREKALMKEHYLTWGIGSTWIGKGDQKITVGDGWYQQIKKRGNYREYDDITKIIDVMKDMMDQLFAGNKMLPKDRRIKFTMGRGVMIAAQKAFREYAFGRNMFMIVNDGKNPITNGIWTGDFQNLKYAEPRVISIEFPEYGVIEIEHNEALDYIDEDEEDTPGTGMYRNSSYMMWVEDVTSDQFSNAIPKGAKNNTINGVTNVGGDANVVMVLPENYTDTTSFIVGTGCNPTLKAFAGQAAYQSASTLEKGFTVVMDFAGELFIKDPSRIYIAEYFPKRTFY